MVKVTVYQNQDLGFLGFKSTGHAGYAVAGEDVVCAGVSVLVINTVNSLDALTDNEFDVDQDAEKGLIELKAPKGLDGSGELLMRSMILGLKELQKSYGDKYVAISFQEV